MFCPWVCPPRFVTRIARRLLDLSPSSASLVHGVSLITDKRSFALVCRRFVLWCWCHSRRADATCHARCSPPTTKQRRALEPRIQPLSASNSAAPRQKLGRDPGLRGCTWGGARIREFENPGVLSSITRATAPPLTHTPGGDLGSHLGEGLHGGNGGFGFVSLI